MNQSEILADLYATIKEWVNDRGCRVCQAGRGSRCSLLDDAGGPPSMSIVACETSEADVPIVSHPSSNTGHNKLGIQLMKNFHDI
jgi:hypothetical protein